MVPLDYVLAVAVLTAPPSSDETTVLRTHACIARTIREVALFWEVLDPREIPTFFSRPADFDQDIQLLRKRVHELKDAPAVSDALRFPGREAACEMLSFNREYYRTLKQRREAMGPNHGELDRALEEVDQLYHIWDLVRDARSDCYYISARRHALMALRQSLGAEDYYRGVLPPHVPVWRFDRRD
jgi:hypothetical protein